MRETLKVAISLGPVFLFLVGLFALDSFKLVRPASIARAILAGIAAAVACLLLGRTVLMQTRIDASLYSQVIAPLVEEGFKAVFVVVLISRKRLGFMVDAAIVGFATGAGFALVENLYYLLAVHDANLLLWAIRGFGTAVLHGGATAILAIVSKLLADIRVSESLIVFLPGYAAAVVLHAIFNRLVVLFPPVVSPVVLLAAFPVLILVVFARSERVLRAWLEVGFGSDVELLEMLRSGEIKDTRIGVYLRTLKDRLPGEVLADMLCYLETWVQLSIRAKGRLLLSEAGWHQPDDPMLADRLRELAFLEKSIGMTGRLALTPFLHDTRRVEWQVEMLRKDVRS